MLSAIADRGRREAPDDDDAVLQLNERRRRELQESLPWGGTP